VGATWWVNVTGQPSLHRVVPGASSAISVGLLNDTYLYTIGGPDSYRSGPSSGSFLVNGAKVGIDVNFTWITYSVTFKESGLPPHTSWNVLIGPTLLTSTGRSVTFELGNGSYSYAAATVVGYAANPTAGTITVSGKAPAPTRVPFGPANTVTFVESGLPLAQGYQWSLNVAGQIPVSSTADTIVLELADGTYAYSVTSTSTYLNFGGSSSTGYSPAPAVGTFTVSGSPVEVKILFSPTLWDVTFVEVGLPHGTPWHVTLVSGAGFVTLWSTGPTITFQIVNGTYGYMIGPVPGYSTTSTGSFLVWGAPIQVDVTFS